MLLEGCSKGFFASKIRNHVSSPHKLSTAPKINQSTLINVQREFDARLRTNCVGGRLPNLFSHFLYDAVSMKSTLIIITIELNIFSDLFAWSHSQESISIFVAVIINDDKLVRQNEFGTAIQMNMNQLLLLFINIKGLFTVKLFFTWFNINYTNLVIIERMPLSHAALNAIFVNNSYNFQCGSSKLESHIPMQFQLHSFSFSPFLHSYFPRRSFFIWLHKRVTAQ